jgi:hypothetical protein
MKEKPTGIFQAEDNTDIILNMQKTFNILSSNHDFMSEEPHCQLSK